MSGPVRVFRLRYLSTKEKKEMSRVNLSFAFLSLMTLTVLGCGAPDDAEDSSGDGEQTQTSGGGSESDTSNDPEVILIDGSSTVYPVTVAMAEGFSKASGSTNVKVNAPSGTSGGFKKFVTGSTDINDASRPIKDKEVQLCADNNIEAVELTVAIDGISVVVNKENTWCDSLTFAQLKAMWEPNAKVKTWKDLNPEWPDEKIKLYGPDGDSGTFEYFTEKVIELKKECTDDYQPAVDDNLLVTGVKNDRYALGYFGYGYYLRAREDLKGLSIAGAEGDPVSPTPETIESYEYPLARPIFIYVNKNRLTDTNMKDFLNYYLGEGQALVSQAGCVKLSEEVLEQSRKNLTDALPE